MKFLHIPPLLLGSTQNIDEAKRILIKTRHTFIVLSDCNMMDLKILKWVRNKYCVLLVKQYTYYNAKNYINPVSAETSPLWCATGLSVPISITVKPSI